MSVQRSKFLSLVLRHKPGTIGIELDEAGWVSVESLLASLQTHPAGRWATMANLENVVEANDKRRFEFSEDRSRIRARQGHSVAVDLGYEPAEPPERLYHGTPIQFVELIRESGLKKMNRHHVHLHADLKVAEAVAARRGQPVLLTIRSGEMHKVGIEFFVTENNVWLTAHVPAEFIDFPSFG